MNLKTNSRSFMTKSMRIERKNPGIEGFWPIAIDVGYSAVKVISPNVAASFPSYAKKVSFGSSDSAIGKLSKSAIFYRDTEKNEYFVGSLAEKVIEGETDSFTASMFVRNRYYSQEFLILIRTGLALSMKSNAYGAVDGSKIRIMTGLPPAYLKGDDKEALFDAFCGEHEFYLKLGDGKDGWEHFKFSLTRKDIDIMAQPLGTLISISTNANGKRTPLAEKYFSSKLIVMDPGFGTLDTFEIQNSIIRDSKTWTDLGMKEVLSVLSQRIEERYGVYISIPSMQEILGQGYFIKTDRKTHSSQKISFDELLFESSKEVANRALNAIDNSYNGLNNHEYLVVTGGTGAAWFDYVKDYYKNMENLHILNGWDTDELPPVFSNVRGYYYYLCAEIKRNQHEN